MVRIALVATLVACSAPAKKAPVGVPAPPVAAPVVPPLTDEAADVAVRYLTEVGKRHTERLEAAFPAMPVASEGEINAFGPCMRPSEEARTALRTRLIAWLDKESPDEVHEHSGDDLEALFGCYERTGIVVDLQIDRTKRASQKVVGRWLIVRVSDTRIERIAEYSGLPKSEQSTGITATTLSTFVLADVDRDGLLDVIANRDEHEDGAGTTRPSLAVFTSRGKITPFGAVGTTSSLELAPGQNPPGRGAVVLLVKASDDKPAKYGCVLESGYVDSCAAGGIAKRHDQAVEAAQRLAQISPGSTADLLPDRDELDQLLATLGARPPERAPLLALVPPTPGLRRVVRAAAELVAKRPTDDERPLHAGLRTDLGDTACTQGKGDHAAARAWLAKKSPTARNTVVKQPCSSPQGTYVELHWLDGEPALWSGAILFVPSAAGAAPVVIGEAQDTEYDPSHGPHGDTVSVATYRRGNAAIALTLVQGKKLVATVDGSTVGQLPKTGVQKNKDLAHYRASDTLVVLETAEGKELWHATETALVKVGEVHDATVRMPAATAPLMKRVVERERRELAWQALVSVDEGMLESDASYRDDILRALDVVGADPMLRAEIERNKLPETTVKSKAK